MLASRRIEQSDTSERTLIKLSDQRTECIREVGQPTFTSPLAVVEVCGRTEHEVWRTPRQDRSQDLPWHFVLRRRGKFYVLASLGLECCNDFRGRLLLLGIEP